MAKNSDYIRFDWAIKRILRDKANFAVLEGLMTVLLGEKITIVEMLESESNVNSREDKYNRVDMKAKTSTGEIIIVEVQLGRESFFMPRILFGVSKAIIEQMRIAENYSDIHKIYSINILYFDLGKGDDYAYHGKFRFTGMNNPQSELTFSESEKKEVLPRKTGHTISHDEVFPEFYLLRVNQFNEVAKTPIEEWMDYLKDGIIRDDTTAPGLQEAREMLNYMRMTREERLAYEDYMISVRAAEDVVLTAKAEGRAEGRAEGIEAANINSAKKMKQKGFSLEDISEITGLSLEQLEDI